MKVGTVILIKVMKKIKKQKLIKILLKKELEIE